jgi:peptidoglycan hydrolase CwlO-like protein
MAMFDIHIHVDNNELLERIKAMTVQLEKLTAEVEENTSVTASAIALLDNLSDQIRELKDDPAALEALASRLVTSGNELAAAVTANTPAEEPTE